VSAYVCESVHVCSFASVHACIRMCGCAGMCVGVYNVCMHTQHLCVHVCVLCVCVFNECAFYVWKCAHVRN